MKYLFIALLLSVSSSALADLQYMTQQMTVMRDFHAQQMRQEQQNQEDQTRSYLQQKYVQNNANRHHRRQPRQINQVNRLESSIQSNNGITSPFSSSR
jgi:hypothetical protein